MSNLANKVDVVFAKRAFQMLQIHSDTEKTRVLFSKFKSCQFLLNSISSLYSVKLHQAFTHFKDSLLIRKKNTLAVNSMTKFFLTKKLRDYLQLWRQESERKSLKRFHNREGPTAIETHNLHRELNALRDLCRDEGITPEKIQKVMARS